MGGEADGSRAWAAYVAWTPGNISIHRALETLRTVASPGFPAM